MAVKQLDERRRGARAEMHAVGDVINLVMMRGIVRRQHLSRYLAVPLAHAVDVMAEVERQIRHVQFAGAAEHIAHGKHVRAPENVRHMIERKLVVPRRDRRVRRKDALRANGLHVLLIEGVAFETARPFVEEL
jgi:hypothetical protein